MHRNNASAGGAAGPLNATATLPCWPLCPTWMERDGELRFRHRRRHTRSREHVYPGSNCKASGACTSGPRQKLPVKPCLLPRLQRCSGRRHRWKAEIDRPVSSVTATVSGRVRERRVRRLLPHPQASLSGEFQPEPVRSRPTLEPAMPQPNLLSTWLLPLHCDAPMTPSLPARL